MAVYGLPKERKCFIANLITIREIYNYMKKNQKDKLAAEMKKTAAKGKPKELVKPFNEVMPNNKNFIGRQRMRNLCTVNDSKNRITIDEATALQNQFRVRADIFLGSYEGYICDEIDWDEFYRASTEKRKRMIENIGETIVNGCEEKKYSTQRAVFHIWFYFRYGKAFDETPEAKIAAVIQTVEEMKPEEWKSISDECLEQFMLQVADLRNKLYAIQKCREEGFF